MREDPAGTSDELRESHQTIKVWESAELFDDAKLIQIRHGGEVYQLRITRQGKLILNK